MGKYTSDDIRRLAALIRRRSDDGHRLALLTGAGCSVSAGIPLANELIARIDADYGAVVRHRLGPGSHSYGAWMACLARNERRDLLRPLLEDARINWGHLAIAAMIKAGHIGRVLTFNFDQLLARACGLLGLQPAIYDFGIAPTARVDHLPEPAIVHLHGQGYGLVLLNTEKETREHAEALRPLIRETFERHPLLVIGYSGRADEVFPTLKALYEGEERLFWIGHGDEPGAEVAALIEVRDHAEYLGGADADAFLIELAQALDCWPPLLFSNPAAHLLGAIAPVMPYPRDSIGGEDLLGRLDDYLTELKETVGETIVTTSMRLMLEGRWDEVIARGVVAERDRDLVAWAHVMRAVDAAGRGEAEKDRDLFEQAFADYAAALEMKPDMHDALNNWGTALSALARQTGKEALFRESFEKFTAAVAVKPDKHEAFNNWGKALVGLAGLSGNEALYRESVEKFTAALVLKPNMPEALNNLGIALAALARLTGDADLYRASLGKLAAAVAVKPDDHEALNNWGTALSDLARLTGDADLYRASFEKYAAALAVKPDFHEALDNWASALLLLWRLAPEPDLLVQAEAKAREAEAISGRPSYNLGCALSLQGDEAGCRGQLERCLTAGTLPDGAHLSADEDLAAWRERDWFRDLLAGRAARSAPPPPA